uniref:Uncharacterized protein n=1 Tax=Magnetococcus massalia (strain MO-1) TaxID=451514 RepID=A0A1S7LLC6_MAGMO|nr:conserved protein of unknown function [Candidatus Magnetococcus massalia]
MTDRSNRQGLGVLGRMAGLFVGVCMIGLPLTSQSTNRSALSSMDAPQPRAPLPLSWSHDPAYPAAAILGQDLSHDESTHFQTIQLTAVELTASPLTPVTRGTQVASLGKVSQRILVDMQRHSDALSSPSWVQEMLHQPVALVELAPLSQSVAAQEPLVHVPIDGFQLNPELLAKATPAPLTVARQGTLLRMEANLRLDEETVSDIPYSRGMPRPGPRPKTSDIPIIEMSPLGAAPHVPEAQATEKQLPEISWRPSDSSIQVVQMTEIIQRPDTPEMTLPIHGDESAITAPAPLDQPPRHRPTLLSQHADQPSMPDSAIQEEPISLPGRRMQPSFSARRALMERQVGEKQPERTPEAVVEEQRKAPPPRRGGRPVAGSKQRADVTEPVKPAQTAKIAPPEVEPSAKKTEDQLDTDWLDRAIEAVPDTGEDAGIKAALPADPAEQARLSQMVIPVVDIPDPDHASLTLFWPEPVKYRKKVKGREAVFKFNAHFNPKGLDKAVQKLQGWLGDVRYGYDTLLVSAAMAGTDFEVTADGQKMVIGLQRPPPEAEGGAERKVTESRLRFLSTKAMRAEKTLHTAKSRMTGLLGESPENTEFLGEQGNLEQEMFRWRRAIALYDRGLIQAPGEKNLIFAKAGIHYGFGDWLRIDQSFKNTNTNDENQELSSATYHYTYRHHWDATLKLSHGNITINNLTRVDGSIDASAEEEWWSQGLTIGYDHDDGDRTEVAALNAGHGMGFSARHLIRLPDESETEISATFREAYDGLAITLADDGYRSRLRVSHLNHWPDRFRTVLSGSVNQFGIDGDEDAVISAMVSASLRYDLLGRANQELSYTWEREEVFHSAYRSNNGVRYQLLPYEDRDNHNINFGWFDQLTDYLRYEAAVGYSYDTITKAKGPAFFAGLVYEPLHDFQAGMRLSSTTSATGAADSRTEQLQAYIRFLF